MTDPPAKVYKPYKVEPRSRTVNINLAKIVGSLGLSSPSFYETGNVSAPPGDKVSIEEKYCGITGSWSLGFSFYLSAKQLITGRILSI